MLLASVIFIVAPGKIFESSELPLERQPAGTNGTITLLTNDDFRNTLIRGILVVYLVSVNKHDDIGILLDRT